MKGRGGGGGQLRDEGGGASTLLLIPWSFHRESRRSIGRLASAPQGRGT